MPGKNLSNFEFRRLPAGITQLLMKAALYLLLRQSSERLAQTDLTIFLFGPLMNIFLFWESFRYLENLHCRLKGFLVNS